MAMEGDLTLGYEHEIKYTDDVLWNCILETSIILLTDITPINSMKIKKGSHAHFRSVTICAYG